jgi:hypothetical protein
MELTKDNFDDFVSRLRYHDNGKGVNKHCTRNPLFIVEKRERVYGFDGDYSDQYEWHNSDDPEYKADKRTATRLDKLDDGGRDTAPWKKVYYEDRWEFVSAHFTKEAAEAYVRRKHHDYIELRVFVECQIYCWEFNAIIDGLLAGRIVFSEKADKVSKGSIEGQIDI